MNKDTNVVITKKSDTSYSVNTYYKNGCVCQFIGAIKKLETANTWVYLQDEYTYVYEHQMRTILKKLELLNKVGKKE